MAIVLRLFAVCSMIVGCASCAGGRGHGEPEEQARVGRAWEAGKYAESQVERDPVVEPDYVPAHVPAPAPNTLDSASDTGPSATLATVNGRPIARRRLVNLLLRSYGAGLLEQLVMLEAAEQLAGEKGLTIEEGDVDREFRRFLRRLAEPLSLDENGPFDRERAERLLDTVLADRNMSSAEFRIGIRRNAYLRAIVESEQSFTERELREEFERAYGERVRIRDIQLGTPAEVSRVSERLAAGEDFAELARRHSAGFAGARSGGLLEPFSRNDPNIPEIIRRVAFGLEPGEVSDAVRVGQWYHLMKLENRIPPEDRKFAEVRGELHGRLRDRLAEPAMEELYERLFSDANIVIYDPVLRDAFLRAYPDRGREK